MPERVAIYTRKHDAEAWQFERVANREAGILARDVNANLGVHTLLIPLKTGVATLTWLDSSVSQGDFPILDSANSGTTPKESSK